MELSQSLKEIGAPVLRPLLADHLVASLAACLLAWSAWLLGQLGWLACLASLVVWLPTDHLVVVGRVSLLWLLLNLVSSVNKSTSSQLLRLSLIWLVFNLLNNLDQFILVGLFKLVDWSTYQPISSGLPIWSGLGGRPTKAGWWTGKQVKQALQAVDLWAGIRLWFLTVSKPGSCWSQTDFWAGKLCDNIPWFSRMFSDVRGGDSEMLFDVKLCKFAPRAAP